MTFSQARLTATYQREVDTFNLTAIRDAVTHADHVFRHSVLRWNVAFGEGAGSAGIYRHWVVTWAMAANAIDRYEYACRQVSATPVGGLRDAIGRPAVGRRPGTYIDEVQDVVDAYAIPQVQQVMSGREDARQDYANTGDQALNSYQGWTDADLWFNYQPWVS